jgi:TrmH family RNA methyltransferase
MFPLKKLAELSTRTRARKTARILHALEMDLLLGRGFDARYLQELLSMLSRDPDCADAVSSLSHAVSSGMEPSVILRGANVLRNALLASVGAEPSEWDLVSAETGALDRSGVQTFPASVFLEDIRSPFNVGSILRTAEAFGVERVYLSPQTPLPTHPRARKTARGAEAALPWEVRNLEGISGLPGVFALETGGVSIEAFEFPTRGTVLVGSEELGLSPEALSLADAGLGRVAIPLAGAKRSLNVSVAFGILVSRWRASVKHAL